MKRHTTPEVYAAALAESWRAEIGLPKGSLWVPPIVRALSTELTNDADWEGVEWAWRSSLGLPTQATTTD